ncbi:{ManC} Mannose-1-phosphate guanylyltransferase [Caulobacteraceae bacterium]
MSPQILPVILCGGSGTRLWPLSTAVSPKQFLTLFGDRSTFRLAAERAVAIAGVDQILVVANTHHRDHVLGQLGGLEERTRLLLEPCSRNSAAAIAAACVHLERTAPDAVAVFLSADHHIPDPDAFARAVQTGVAAALEGRIVTLGLRPTGPSTAFGYILAGDGAGAARPVRAFVEKPDAATAERYVEAGYLWNSGTFIARPASLLAELERHAPAVLAAALAAVEGAEAAGEVTTLGGALAAAPAVSIDHAVMEKTDRAQVVPADFAWSDVGDWRAVLNVSARDDQGNSLSGAPLLIDSRDCVVRVPPGVNLAMIGVRDLAVIVGEDGSILICDLSSTQLVGQASDHFD